MNFTKYLKEKKISLRELSMSCDIPYATLYNNIEKPETMKVTNLKKISAYLGITMEVAFAMMCDRGISLLKILLEQKESKLAGNIYHFTQINFAYNTNRIEGSQLTEDETRYIFETNTLIDGKGSNSIDDIVETANHFYLFDIMLEEASELMSEKMIKAYHQLLKNGTMDARKDWFNVGDYKQLPNEIGGKATTAPKNVPVEMKKMLLWYNGLSEIGLDEILKFHHRFECIHPFQDGNGRIGRILMFKECLRNNVMPFIIEDPYKAFYYRGLSKYEKEATWLKDTCLSMQDKYRDTVNRLLPELISGSDQV